jgi:hypothetical protein
MAGIRHHPDLPDAGFLEDAVDLVRPRRRRSRLAFRFCCQTCHRAALLTSFFEFDERSD